MADPQSLPQVANENLTAPNTGDNIRPGAPTVPGKAVSQVDNTSTGASNKNLAHVCDISGNIKYSIAWISLQVKQLVESIRQAIQALWKGVSGSPFGDGASTIVTAIKNMVDQIKILIQKAKDAQSAVAGYIAQLQQLLIYIATLPARLAAFLKECISETTASIKDAITNAQSIVDSQSGGALNTANSSITTVNNTLNNTQNATVPSSAGNPAGIP